MEARKKTSKDKGKKLISQASQAISFDNMLTINWMEKGLLNEVRDQCRCRCWAIVSCAATESLYNINNQPTQLFQLAPQELVNCVKKDYEACYTCSINEGFRYAIQYGIRCEIDCPFLAQKHLVSIKTRIRFKNTDKEDEDGIIEVLKKHPLGAAIFLTEKLKKYKKGIYEEPNEIFTKDANHSVLLMGCGTDKETGKNFWVIQNSWGTSWGMNGYAKVMRSSSLPTGSQPILSRLSYPEDVDQFVCSKEQIIEYCPTR
ncbi:hypothetical protein LOK49_LG11G00253 [Camellia lanceoleosa]|uniref:Uncharacterized protein n=1 Tax=Camellia lanceoleosa TaxID=1840588 RepID=A0ACC0G442_9ERIC|nr:hypothetical protein LOK49_LG11G00253 [Camellia lanceoleosa]